MNATKSFDILRTTSDWDNSPHQRWIPHRQHPPSIAIVHGLCVHVDFDACSKRSKLGSNFAQVPKKSAFVFVVPSKTITAPSWNEATLRQISRGAMDAKRRKLAWVARQNFQGWACTECAWVFSVSGPPVGKSLEEMKRNYEQQRDKEFTSHICTQQPRAE